MYRLLDLYNTFEGQLSLPLQDMQHVVWIALCKRIVLTVRRRVRITVIFACLLYCKIHSSFSVYLDPVSHGDSGWPVSTLIDGIPDIENVTDALRNGPYGQCVYESPNDVCDHQVGGSPVSRVRDLTSLFPQVVNLEFSNGATASFTMVAYTSLICERQTRLHFTHGELVGDMSTFTVTDFRTGRSTVHHPKLEGGGHGGGDLGLIKTFVEAVKTGRQELLGTNVSEVLKSHLTVFAAEHSRRKGTVVDCVEFEKSAREQVAVTNLS